MRKLFRYLYGGLRRRVLDWLYPPRHTKDYATHVPYLIGLVKQVQPKRILEFGCGEYSTLLFLDRSIHPSLVQLDSYENDRSWFQTLSERVGGDPRIKLHYTDRPMAEAVPSIDLAAYDLVFIDDSQALEQRAQTIQAIFARWPLLSIVAVHDFEIPEYQKAARSGLHSIILKSYLPFTGLFWREGCLSPQGVQQIRKTVQTHVDRIAPDDRDAWQRVFGSLPKTIDF